MEQLIEGLVPVKDTIENEMGGTVKWEFPVSTLMSNTGIYDMGLTIRLTTYIEVNIKN